MRWTWLVAAVALAAACDKRSKPAPDVAKLADPSQTGLAKEVDEAARRGTYLEVKRRWTGQHVSWKVTYQQAICPKAERCNVRAFPISSGSGAEQGWLPIVEFAPGQYDALVKRCTSDPCDVTITGDLDVSVSGELPTKVTIKHASVGP